MAQSKPKRNRRPLDFRQQWQPELVLPISEGLARVSGRVRASFVFEQEMIGGGAPFEVKLAIPTLASPSGGLFTTAEAAFDGETQQLNVFFDGVPGGQACEMMVLPWQEGLRRFNGGYVAPQIFKGLSTPA